MRVKSPRFPPNASDVCLSTAVLRLAPSHRDLGYPTYRAEPPPRAGRRRAARVEAVRQPRPCSPPSLSAAQGLEVRAMQSPAPPKPWERSGCPVAPAAASTPGSTAGPSAAAQSPAAQQTSWSTATSQPSYTTPALSTPYGGLASRGYGGASMYGGSPYGGSPYGYGGAYGAGGLYGGGGMYGGGMYGGGPFGAFGMQGDKELPSGIRQIEQMLAPLYLPCTSPISPLYLAYIPPRGYGTSSRCW
jgi:hypothetical protein